MEERKIAINPCPLGDEEILSFCTECWSEGRARLGDFPATMARKITQLSPSLTPTLGIVLSFCYSYLALWQPLSGIRRSRWLARRSVFRFRQIKTMSVNAPRARVSPTDRPTALSLTCFPPIPSAALRHAFVFLRLRSSPSPSVSSPECPFWQHVDLSSAQSVSHI